MIVKIYFSRSKKKQGRVSAAHLDLIVRRVLFAFTLQTYSYYCVGWTNEQTNQLRVTISFL